MPVFGMGLYRKQEIQGMFLWCYHHGSVEKGEVRVVAVDYLLYRSQLLRGLKNRREGPALMCLV